MGNPSEKNTIQLIIEFAKLTIKIRLNIIHLLSSLVSILFLISSLVFVLLGVRLEPLIIKSISYIGDTFNIWGTITLSFIFIVLLYLFRQTFRLSYGILEFSFGFCCVILPMFENNFDYTSIDFGYSIILRLIAGAYVTVRGIDNICKGLKERQWLIMVTKFLKYE